MGELIFFPLESQDVEATGSTSSRNEGSMNLSCLLLESSFPGEESSDFFDSGLSLFCSEDNDDK